MKQLIYLAVFCITTTTVAQTSIFQDSKGEAAYKIFDNALSINTSDQSIIFNVSKLTRDKKSTVAKRDIFNRIGVSLKLNAKEGVSNLKLKDKFTVDGELGIYYGKKRVPLAGPGTKKVSVREKYISVTIGIDRNRFFFAENDSVKIDFISDPTFKVEVGQFGYVKSMLYGVSLNYGHKTNVKDLKVSNINIIQSISNQTIQVSNEDSAFDKLKYDTGLQFANINGDIGFQINEKQVNTGDMPGITLAFHFRYLIQENAKPKFNPALGLYFAAKVGEPKKIALGINAQIVDALDKENKNNSPWERTAITINAGYIF